MHMFWLSQALSKLILLQTCTTTGRFLLFTSYLLPMAAKKRNMAFQKDRKLPFLNNN